MTPLPSFVVPLCVAAGVLLVAAGIPLSQRRIPPNPFFGIRLASTLGNDRLWYEVNARAGRDLVGIGTVYLILLGLAARFGASWPPALRVVGPLAVLVVGLMIDTVVLMRTARRLDDRR
jgi:uncharacterized membrane protein